MTPSLGFQKFLSACVYKALDENNPVRNDIFEKKLWASAEFDWFNQSGQIISLINDDGLAIETASLYRDDIQLTIAARNAAMIRQPQIQAQGDECEFYEIVEQHRAKSAQTMLIFRPEPAAGDIPPELLKKDKFAQSQ
ncbi:MAG: hypothetical protein NTX25_23280 [Proteobacteria bacterium]|nr:hypothetical protein [Pseudomonadota bacterium]